MICSTVTLHSIHDPQSGFTVTVRRDHEPPARDGYDPIGWVKPVSKGVNISWIPARYGHFRASGKVGGTGVGRDADGAMSYKGREGNIFYSESCPCEDHLVVSQLWFYNALFLSIKRPCTSIQRPLFCLAQAWSLNTGSTV